MPDPNLRRDLFVCQHSRWLDPRDNGPRLHLSANGSHARRPLSMLGEHFRERNLAQHEEAPAAQLIWSAGHQVIPADRDLVELGARTAH